MSVTWKLVLNLQGVFFICFVFLLQATLTLETILNFLSSRHSFDLTGWDVLSHQSLFPRLYACVIGHDAGSLKGLRLILLSEFLKG